MWLFARRHPDFHRFRSAVITCITASNLVCVPFPCDPPRQLDHVIDTIDDLHGLDLDEGPISYLYNPLAAFPSIHLAFAVVTAAAVFTTAEHPALRAGAVVYPPAVAFTVVVTGNHYVLDILAGAALGALALRLAR